MRPKNIIVNFKKALINFFKNYAPNASPIVAFFIFCNDCEDKFNLLAQLNVYK